MHAAGHAGGAHAREDEAGLKMDRSLSVQTPESIAFSYDLAGLGSRFLAVAIDMLIQIAILAAIFWGLVLAASAAPAGAPAAAKLPESLMIALITSVLFLVFFGYFILFEAFWSGQTPGKKLLALRVVRDAGYPLDFAGAAIRNLVRVGELTLGFYAISAIACVASPENKRLGDMAAGTIVVRDARVASLASLVEDAKSEARSPLLDENEHAIIDQFIARRKGLAPAVRAKIAARIAQQVRSRVSYDLQSLPDEALLERLSAS